jgi:hypothetical protein
MSWIYLIGAISFCLIVGAVTVLIFDTIEGNF